MAKNKSTERLTDAPKGRGCSHCEIGQPIDYFERSKIMIKLCLECVLIWFAGWTVIDWEANHAPLADHLGDRLDEAMKKELRDGLRALLKGGLKKREVSDD
ncbi:hypothetical protein LCGC14_0353430 [marine sediment metagenome]|uniref:Uncharacterized protein n=1 Tax=marine sediment metagenome TaxID=412755 RepID=A0A0F9VXC9_9ZZZZ